MRKFVEMQGRGRRVLLTHFVEAPFLCTSSSMRPRGCSRDKKGTKWHAPTCLKSWDNWVTIFRTKFPFACITPIKSWPASFRCRGLIGMVSTLVILLSQFTLTEDQHLAVVWTCRPQWWDQAGFDIVSLILVRKDYDLYDYRLQVFQEAY